jgi:hypothetical protein
MFLAFLTILGGSLLMTSTIDVWIGDNFQRGTQLLYVAEAGIEQGRENLRLAAATTTSLLTTAAGADLTLSTSTDLQTLIDSDDVAVIDGATLADASGRTIGTYYVWLRNDVADTMTSRTDSNDVVNLLSIAVIGQARKVIETTVSKGSFPDMPAALTLNGTPTFDPANSNNFGISGIDPLGDNENAIGVIADADRTTVLDAIPDAREDNYPGSGDTTPPPADVANIDSELNIKLKTPAGMEQIVSSLAASATDTYNPAYGASTALGNVGSSTNYRVVVVNGDCTFGPGTGYGILLVRGNLTMTGNFAWHGLILIIGQGSFTWNGGGNGQINGAMFLARTRENDRSADNLLGTMRTTRGPVVADFNGGGENAIQLDKADMTAVNSAFPFSPISYKEY